MTQTRRRRPRRMRSKGQQRQRRRRREGRRPGAAQCRLRARRCAARKFRRAAAAVCRCLWPPPAFADSRRCQLQLRQLVEVSTVLALELALLQQPCRRQKYRRRLRPDKLSRLCQPSAARPARRGASTTAKRPASSSVFARLCSRGGSRCSVLAAHACFWRRPH